MDSFGKKSTAYVCYIIVSIIWYLALFAGILMVVGVSLMLLGWVTYPPEISFNIPISVSEVEFSRESISEFITISEASVDIESQYIYDRMPGLFVGMQFFVAFCFCFVLYGFHQLRMVLKTTVYEAVFTKKNIRRLKTLAFIVMAIDPLGWIYHYVFARNFISFVEQQNLSITLGNFEMGYIVYGLLLFTLAAIFERGYKMYQELKLTV